MWDLKTNSDSSNQKYEWGSLYHDIFDNIPLLDFAYKVANAYPTADRNLNLEIFRSRIIEKRMAKPHFSIDTLSFKQQQAQTTHFNDYQHLVRRAFHFFLLNYSLILRNLKADNLTATANKGNNQQRAKEEARRDAELASKL